MHRHSHSANFRFKYVFGHQIRRKSALCSRILFASTNMHRRRSNSPLHFDIQKTYQIRTEKQNDSAWRLLLATLLEWWPQVCHVKIKLEWNPWATKLVRFHQNQFGKMLCKLDSREYNGRANKTQSCLITSRGWEIVPKKGGNKREWTNKFVLFQLNARWMSSWATKAEKRQVHASGLLLCRLCCAGVQPARLLSAICIHLA